MADGTYQPKTYKKDGGDTLIVASGGVMDVESGGSLKLAGTALTPTAAQINKLASVTASAAELNRLAAATPGVDATNIATVADLAIGVPVVLRVDVADAASQNIDIAMPYKVRVIYVWGVKAGGAGGAANTVKIQNVTNDITDAMSLNINDKAQFEATTIDDAYHEIAAAANLRIVTAKTGGNCAFILYVKLLKVA